MTDIYLPLKKNAVIVIRTNSNDVLKNIRLFSLMHFSQEPLKHRMGKAVDFSCFIRVLDKKTCYYKNSEWSAYSNKIKGKCQLKIISPRGSVFKLYSKERIFKVTLLKQDVDAKMFFWSHFFSIVMSFSLHASWVKINGCAFLLVGDSGMGKTTLSKFMVEKFKGSTVVADDKVLLLHMKNVYAWYLHNINCERVHTIFFLERNQRKISSLCRINKTEAFKRIIFHADVIFKKDDAQTDSRINALKKVVSQARCFVLVNGKDLKNNPDKLKDMVKAAVKSCS